MQLIQLMLMMRSALGSDGSQMCGAWDQILHRTSSHAADPVDADDAQCLGSDRSQLMLMIRVLWITSFTANPADADDVRCFGFDRSQLIQLMLMMRGAWDQIVHW